MLPGSSVYTYILTHVLEAISLLTDTLSGLCPQRYQQYKGQGAGTDREQIPRAAATLTDV